MRTTAMLVAVLATACNPSIVDLGGAGSGVDVLGAGDHSLAAVTVTEIASDALLGPRDLAFHPDVPSLLWVVNRDDDSIVLFDTSEAEPEADLRKSGGAEHFLARPSALAFGDAGFLATIHEQDAPTQGEQTPEDFMGPTLWTADVDEFEGGATSHYDMLHNSPNGAGIAWERDNAYWVFDGFHEAITRYDFQSDHGPGEDDHTDGIIARYGEGEVSYVEDVPSHLVFDPSTSLLYIADGGNGRVAVLDTATGDEAGTISPNYDGCEQYEVEAAELRTLVDTSAVPELIRPSGIELRGDRLFVTDNTSGIVFAFSLDGTLIDWLDLELPDGALMGVTAAANGDLWLVDGASEKVLHVAPLTEG